MIIPARICTPFCGTLYLIRQLIKGNTIDGTNLPEVLSGGRNPAPLNEPGLRNAAPYLWCAFLSAVSGKREQEARNYAKTRIRIRL